MGLPIKELLNIGKVQLESSGDMDAAIDAKELYCFMKCMTKKDFLLNWQYEASDDDCEKYFQLIDRRASGEPTQYITGVQGFMGHEFKVDKRVLIPRQDTETMVEDALELLEKGTVRGEEIASKKAWDVLDLCCGSGAIGISIAAGGGKIGKVTCADVSGDALELARENAQIMGMDKIKFVKSDMLGAFKGRFKKQKFDLIISNPPYIKSDVIPTLQREVKEHEPMIALDGGADGLDFYRIIVDEAFDHLNKEGVLMLEIGHDQGQDLVKMLEDTEKFEKVRCLKDLAGRDRIIVAQAKNLKK